jgi:hypothetical protein
MRQAISEAKREAKLQNAHSILIEVNGDLIAGEFLEDFTREKNIAESQGFSFRISTGRKGLQADRAGGFRPETPSDGYWKRFHNAFRQTERLLLKAMLVAITAVTSLAYIVEKVDVLLIHSRPKIQDLNHPPDAMPKDRGVPEGEMVIRLPEGLTPKQKAILRDELLEAIKRFVGSP